MEIFDSERMRRADARTIELGLPGLVLMENAGRLAADVLLDEVPDVHARGVLVLAGTGNNGGDGFVLARHLRQAGVPCEAWLVGARRARLAGDAATMAGAWIGTGGPFRELPDAAAWRAAAPALDDGRVVVDALFGTGLSRPLEGLAAEVVAAVNGSGAFVLAIDVPSGLRASTATVDGPAIEADLTVTFARPKPVHFLPPAEDLCGDVVVVDIGIPESVILETGCDLHLVTPVDAALLVPLREAEDHKGRFGHVLVAGGSVGKAGAAALCAAGALRAGAGLCTVATPAEVRPEVAAFMPELMTAPLPQTRDGLLARGAADRVLELAEGRSVLALGPGLGQGAATAGEIRRLVKDARLPVVLDADGLNAFAGRPLRELARRKAPLVITPHPGEAARLAGVETAAIQGDRLGWARRLAREINAVCVLKGYRTLVAAPDGTTFVNPTGNPGMASGGTGDVLTGIVAGLLAQELDPLEAAVLGVYLHGLAADEAVAAGETEASLTASALLQAIPRAYRALERVLEEGDDGEAGA